MIGMTSAIKSSLSLRKITKSYGPISVLKGIDVEVSEGEFIVLLGPSGCGKSTLLHAIAGLHPIDSGDIVIQGKTVTDTPTRERDVAMVFQSYALYPNMSVAQNIGFPLRMRKLSKQEIAKKVAEVARLLQIEPLLDRKPRELSGGQRQRVAIGRALVRDPKVFLFDEPLSNLDATLRVETRAEIKRLHERTGKTMVYVTHDQIEAMTLATRIVVMNKGDIQQIGTPYEIYHKPANTFVARFVGSPSMQFITGRLLKDGSGVRFTDGKDWTLPMPFPELAAIGSTDVILGVRPEHIKLVPSDQEGHEALVDLVESTGPEDNVTLSVNGQKVTARLETGVTKSGQTVKVQIATDKVSLFDAASGKRIN
ncbi:sn-glycerol-3-phosphate ABC transporter ATP-binding protein UgpC [Rhizobium sp. VS19-DR104.2]|uniref:ABC transporter ATP-binding protein n=1 Tax=unclassified Rhizobium TaxID=2613769 RepID=UPI001C5B8859|nr:MULTISPECIES: sn-glycerol-3-phosphate ABC transporter ATP-binding protein UgpC [unclassified Rhizobium]MBZ5762378.1 sn-glycerol-3-phosphate ABC transporter ATP-binding protein UgpC [Rhizobium sp. VS19-DR96]MBZ5769130.1 sn-glycerol-3-phosphate ABC transporter ATP-binding protein UgpC [Rhizobium sp. VS19-DR129.2]MBZ5775958.1 sn-glycerol-3-phosphate ABC transporter ATP-binding protein UgpC [Rhizobium sp. VS19-DRK62.2]MBZ5786278.1 sn-glycerol-3-phosphate ABC transporter ATP-binding protein UgpC 